MTQDEVNKLAMMSYFFKANGYLSPRFIHTGKVACIMPLIFTAAIITLDPDNYENCYEDRWCYHSQEAALKALNAWMCGPEPMGWHRHPRTGRRREDGNPATEYINH